MLRQSHVKDQTTKISLLLIIIIVAVLAIVAVWAFLLSQPSKPGEVDIVISYTGKWQGAVGNGLDVKTVSGAGQTFYPYTRSGSGDMTLTAFITKMDSGSGTLTVTFMTTSGKVLKTVSTDTQYGTVSASWQG